MIKEMFVRINSEVNLQDAIVKAEKYAEDSIILSLISADGTSEISSGITKDELQNLLKSFETEKKT